MKNKKSQGGMWWWIVTAIVAIALGLMILFISKGWLLAGKENVALLSSCRNQGGECKLVSDSDFERGFYKSGCSKDDDDPGDYCCIPKQT